jgi:hypothetical protein
MPHPRSYQPELHPHLIKGLHHEAKLRGVPMTVLLRSIVTQALVAKFEAWIEKNLPADVEIREKRGSGSHATQVRKDLKALGAYRLLEVMDWDDAYIETEGKLFRSNRQTWIDAKKRAQAMIGEF